MSLKVTFVILSLLLINTIICTDWVRPEHAGESQFDDIPEAFPAPQDRILAGYSQFRIQPYYNFLNLSDADQLNYYNYFQNQLVPPIVDYFAHALQIKYPLTSKITFPAGSTICGGIAVSSNLTNGYQSDFLWVLDVNTGYKGNAVASSYVCNNAAGSNRPYVGRSTFFSSTLILPGTDTLRHEMNMLTTMHELTHNLGFAYDQFRYFLDANGKTLTGHYFQSTLLGSGSTVLTVEPLASMVKDHFQCPTMKGAYMENSGADSSGGSHFERRHFGYEFMTSGNVYQMQVSKFTLALLEGSGWYVPDYNFADNYYWGKGKGCNFLYQPCSDANFTFSEFCKSYNYIGCTDPGRGGAECYGDARSDGCMFPHSDVYYDCDNWWGTYYSRFGNNVTPFGRGTGSKCFMGSLSYSASEAAQGNTSFCFKSSCSFTKTSTTLNINVGSTVVQCTKAGPVSVSGYQGAINCPDPVTYCSTVGYTGPTSCPRGCTGRGSCVNGLCVCDPGFSGKDCALTGQW